MPSPADIIAQRFQRCVSDSWGESDLHRLASSGSSCELRSVLDNIMGDSNQSHLLNQKNRLGSTPLRLAATGGHLGCLEMLLEAGADVDLDDVKAQTPLFVAVMNNHVECTRRLLRAGARPDGSDENLTTPLCAALMNGHPECVLFLLEYGAHPDRLYNDTQNRRLESVPYSSIELAGQRMTDNSSLFLVWKALLMCGAKVPAPPPSSYIDPIDQVLVHLFLNRKKCGNLVDLLYQFGVLYEERRCRTMADSYDPECAERLKYLRETPRSLLSACRLVVLSCLPSQRRNLICVDKLPLPHTATLYLKFSDLNIETARS